MPDPAGVWTSMAQFLKQLPAMLPEQPKAILVVSGHWETNGFAFSGAANPSLIYDYGCFPPDTYTLQYDAPGAPALATYAARLLTDAGLKGAEASRLFRRRFGLSHATISRSCLAA